MNIKSSPLGPLLANAFMAPLEEDLIPTLKSCLCNQKRYVDDTHDYVEPTKIEFILNKLNNLHPNFNFTFELKKNDEINFLDVLIKRVNNNKLETGVYPKPALAISISTGMHMHRQNRKQGYLGFLLNKENLSALMKI